ncbi:uncharacterized protein LOC129919332 [Episyrphus balteatus]|uniref:uncharacterized protein LOC129919332 n=1 Tax=Episyrphus balteatus TaxID=286459 RepID=UPI00248671E1|nr:uncharacterized protein LOC129919332 [Episyrphus balteatus]
MEQVKSLPLSSVFLCLCEISNVKYLIFLSKILKIRNILFVFLQTKDMALDLKNYKLMIEENGNVQQFGGEVVLQNILTHELFSAPFEEVTGFYNLQKNTQESNEEAGEVRNGNISEVFKWSDSQTELLLELYEENSNLVGPMKKHRNKKYMWSYIAEELLKSGVRVSADQVEGRFKAVLKKTKLVFKNNQTTGAVRKDIPFPNIMQKIIGNDDSIYPEVFIGPNRMVKKNYSCMGLPSTSRQASPPLPLQNSPCDVSENRSINVEIQNEDEIP